MYGIDWHVSMGFEPRQRIDASSPRVHKLLADNGIGLALVHSLRGVWYDPLEGNREAFLWSGLQNFSDFNCKEWFATDASVKEPTLLPVCTLNPLEGEKRARMILDENLERGCPFWRFYPREQQWNMQHPVFGLALRRLAEASACALLDGTTEEILSMHALAEGKIPIVAGLHFYESADWCMRLGPLPQVYPSIRYFHGPGILDMACGYIDPSRFVFSSGTPTGSVAAVKRLMAGSTDKTIPSRIWQSNSVSLIRRVCG
jgi:hypothetical protein